MQPFRLFLFASIVFFLTYAVASEPFQAQVRAQTFEAEQQAAMRSFGLAPAEGGAEEDALAAAAQQGEGEEAVDGDDGGDAAGEARRALP